MQLVFADAGNFATRRLLVYTDELMVEVQVRATSLSETQALALNSTITLDADSGQLAARMVGKLNELGTIPGTPTVPNPKP